MLSFFLSTGLAASPVRDVVPFDYGWKHRTGLHHAVVTPTEPPVNPDPGPRPAEASPSFDDSSWQSIQLPHDALIPAKPSADACPNGCSGKSFIPRAVLWYRKAFTLPAAWGDGSAVWLDFEGSFRNTQVWINGAKVASHSCGYTPFRIRLDNVSSVRFGGNAPNVIAAFVDPDNGPEGGREGGSGWWYEGGGIYRHASLVRTSYLHVEQDGLFAYSNLSWPDASHGDDGVSGVVHASAAIANDGAKNVDACVTFTLDDPNGAPVMPPLGVSITIAAGASATATASIPAQAPVALWSSASPSLYTVTVAVNLGTCGGPQVTCSAQRSACDEVSVSHGFRSLRYDADDGFFLNRHHFKVRGFCDHNSFAVVGMAVPHRISLFRAQASRAIGGNGRRTSHNPPETAVLQIYDRVGVVVMDENRLFANKTEYVENMGALVKRDRNHPSVVIWSFCNEAGCEGDREAGGPRFREISYRYDGSRPTLANMFTFADLLSDTIDVQGFSHQSRQKLDNCHAKLPHKPIYMSECCSCNTMRDEDEGCETIHDNPHTICTQKSFNARCAELATNASDGVDYASGTMIWTLFDYYGEPPVGGPEVSSTYGQYDLCGFPKAAAFWYRTQWLLTIADGPDKTFYTNGKHEVRIVESWEPPDSFPSTYGNKTRAIHVYSSAPLIELYVNGKSVGTRPVTRMVNAPGSYSEWLAVPYEAGTLSAVARDASGKPVATHERHTNVAAAALELTIDAPSPKTGTGAALLLDGQDAALLRASVMDAAGQVLHLSAHNISFRVVSGPGYIQGTHNGDPHSHARNDATHALAYHGLVRAVVRVTSAAARPAAERELLKSIDVHGPMAADAPPPAAPAPIVVEASAPGTGFAPAVVSISTSLDAADGVMAVAAAGAGKPVDFF